MDGISDPMKNRLSTTFIGNFLPRCCGIATFTSDLYNAVSSHVPPERLGVIAMNNTPEGYEYPDAVTLQIQQDRISDYRQAAHFINDSDADLVCVQHEFGIFGGDAGSHLSALLSALRKPVVTTLHTVLERPEPAYHRSMLELIRYSGRFIVMSERAVRILRGVYGVPASQVTLIHHGTPDVPFTSPDAHKTQFGLDGRPVVLTFGLLSPNKGIEKALEALPPVVERFPNLAYIVLGATHPEVRRHRGEGYRMYLEQKVRDLGLEDNVIFHGRFVEFDELLQFLSAADIYLTPYLNREQIVSGTLAYAVAMGRAVVSTPYWYAEELLANGRGVIVNFGDTRGLTHAVRRLLADTPLRLQLRESAYAFGRRMIWNEVGRRYVEEFRKVLEEQREIMVPRHAREILLTSSGLPALKLDHLRALSDETGLVQHTKGHAPDLRHGYSADDVGRGLVVLARAHEHGSDSLDNAGLGLRDLELIDTYVAFLEQAQISDGYFHNFMDANGRFLDERGSQDTLGRVMWGLGEVLSFIEHDTTRKRAARMFEKAVPHIEHLSYPRAKAYALCGLAGALRRSGKLAGYEQGLRLLAGNLVALYRAHCYDGWHWFEDMVTYGNAKLSEALFAAHAITGDEQMRQCGIESLEFLLQEHWNGRYFDFVGNTGWWTKGGPRAVYDQQPIEAGYLTTACLAAYDATQDERYLSAARHCFDWFLGRNRLGVPLYDSRTGAVADGLGPQGASRNRGAESVIAFLLARLSLGTVSLPQSERVSA